MIHDNAIFTYHNFKLRFMIAPFSPITILNHDIWSQFTFNISFSHFIDNLFQHLCSNIFTFAFHFNVSLLILLFTFTSSLPRNQICQSSYTRMFRKNMIILNIWYQMLPNVSNIYIHWKHYQILSSDTHFVVPYPCLSNIPKRRNNCFNVCLISLVHFYFLPFMIE